MSTRRVASALVAGVLALLFAMPAGAQAFDQNPILFVHGIEGSGGQFESQAMRFMSNGYPSNWIDTVDYNSTRAVGDTSEVDEQIDAKIAELKQRTGKSQVDVVAHSLGTTVMHGYLTDSTLGAQRRANVSHYINVDGQANNPGVPTLAVWAGRGTPGRNMTGAQNVTIPNQTHVQACTSREAFVAYYEFLTGGSPAYDEPVEQNGPIELAGKVLAFPENAGALGTTLEIWPVDNNGQRTGTSPVFSTLITDASTGGGSWGPVTVQADQRYEFALINSATQTIHIYYEPFVRSDYVLRLLQSVAIANTVGNRPGSASGVNIRYKEFWGNQGSENDQLLIDGLNICTPNLCPISKQVNAYFVYDINRDGQTDLSQPDPTLNALPFITGADVFMRGANPPDDTIFLQLLSRGSGPVRTLKIPNWDSVGDGFSIYWRDFENTISLQPYPAPTGGNSLRAPLVPAFDECTQAEKNSIHGGNLASDDACSNPVLRSSTVTLGTSTTLGTKLGFASVDVCNAPQPGSGICSSGSLGGPVPDVRLRGNGSDVLCKAVSTACPGGPGSDYDPQTAAGSYTGNLHSGTDSNSQQPTPICNPSPPNPASCAVGADMTAVAVIPGSSATGKNRTMRITDNYSSVPSTGDPANCSSTNSCSATVRDQLFEVPVVCKSTASASIGSYCGANTTANALVPGIVEAGKAAVVELGQLQVFDSGPNGLRGDTDDQLFAVQGIYIP